MMPARTKMAKNGIRARVLLRKNIPSCNIKGSKNTPPFDNISTKLAKSLVKYPCFGGIFEFRNMIREDL